RRSARQKSCSPVQSDRDARWSAVPTSRDRWQEPSSSVANFPDRKQAGKGLKKILCGGGQRWQLLYPKTTVSSRALLVIGRQGASGESKSRDLVFASRDVSDGAGR